MEFDTRRQPTGRVSHRAASPGRRAAAGRLAGGLAASGLAAGLALAPALPASGASMASAVPSGASTGSAVPSGAGAASAAASGRGTIGGPQLAGHGVIVNYPATHAIWLPNVKASAFVVADAGSGQVLAAKDPHGWYLPASTLKVLTAITLMPVLNPDATVLTTRQAADAVPSKVGLIAGQSYRISDLFKAMLLISANDAAMSVAQATGSVSRGVAMMNAEAHRLQADDTVARRPNGLNGPGQHVSAYDEALFARQALTIPQFMDDELLRTARFPLKPHHKPVTLWNQNTMLETYRGDLGGKIGWTTASKTTFIGWARRGGRTLVVTILHCKPLYELTYAARLMNWGFDEDGKVRPVGVLVPPLPAHTVAHRAAPASPRALPPPARLGVPGIPLVAGLGTVALALVTGVTLAVVIRRGRRGGSPPAD